MVITEDKYEISWGIVNAAASAATVIAQARVRNKNRQDEAVSMLTQNLQKQILKNLSSTVEFSNIYPNIDLQYNIKSEMLKENFIIKDKVNNPVFTFNLDVKNVTPVLQQDNSIMI